MNKGKGKKFLESVKEHTATKVLSKHSDFERDNMQRRREKRPPATEKIKPKLS